LSETDEKVIKFAHSLDKNDKTLWNKTDGSPKIKVFKKHFGDEFDMKSAELKELLGVHYLSFPRSPLGVLGSLQYFHYYLFLLRHLQVALIPLLLLLLPLRHLHYVAEPISEYEENIELGIDLTPNIDDGYVPLHNEDDEEEEEEEEEEVLMPPEDDVL
jgi:hypothetical protein